MSYLQETMYYSFYYINLLITMFLTIFRRFPTISEDFRKFSKCCPKVARMFPNIFRNFPKFSEDSRRLPRKIRRCFDLISIYFGPLSIGTWQTLQADWSKMISHCVDIIFIHTCGIPFFSNCYHSLYHCSLYNNIVYYMEESVLLGTKPLVDSIRHSICDLSGVFFRM